MIGQTTQVDDLRLVALPSAVNCADMFVRFALAEWSLRSLIPEASRIVRHLVAASVEASDPGSPRFLTVRLRLHGDALVLELDDDLSGEPPELPGAQINAVKLPGSRRNMWSELPLPTGMSAAAVPLPQRAPNRTPAVEYQPEQPRMDADSQILQRVLYGLNRGNGG
ncbi:hypothetical protein FHX82_003955 [Amycolatopsis bartoniae]|uniref:Uncharacterized protein n=1 Tax=Amycolatopsis bartoniae TaxID=941986 RepID=A0A8H9MC42_9PSEU|nr:hypothetical protein [Amycolatopsis bartoniae]MBB2936891.1 hypothetical protein [Amycolatopsis bartoniae]TVT07261.1 hypothetical protein FNH07_17130 [Amycolatopsis bartoniae]GHF50965.1 hypothetical protein GCM10017566_25110 [Amycolatopsis bartoniae]